MKLFALSFALAAACATGGTSETTAAASPAQDCGGMMSAVVARGTAVREAPDGTSALVVTLNDRTPVCASNDSRGFGYRRVRLADGRTGFIEESSLQ